MSKEKAVFEILNPPKSYNWKPQPDITAYELALAIHILIVHYLQGQVWLEAAIKALPERIQRHFEEVQ